MISVFAEEFGVSVEEMIGKSRKGDLPYMRGLYCKYRRETSEATFREIAKEINRRIDTASTIVAKTDNKIGVQDEIVMELFNKVKHYFPDMLEPTAKVVIKDAFKTILAQYDLEEILDVDRLREAIKVLTR